jgi:hypothetical protein
MYQLKATQFIRDDHKRMRNLLRLFEDLHEPSPSDKEQLVSEVFTELDVHGLIEEELFYPAAREILREPSRGLITRFIEAHGEVEDLMGELKRLPVDYEDYDTLFGQLIDAVEAHMEEEEIDLLPEVDRLAHGRLDRLGIRMYERQQELMAPDQGLRKAG